MCALIVLSMFLVEDSEPEWGGGVFLGWLLCLVGGIMVSCGSSATNSNRYDVSKELVQVTEDYMPSKAEREINEMEIEIVYYYNRKNGIDDVDTFVMFTYMDKKEAKKILEEVK